MTGTDLILKERIRQINDLGFDSGRDDEYVKGELVFAAHCYFMQADKRVVNNETGVPTQWPWSTSWWKPKTRVDDLIKAGALYMAEKDRLSRLKNPPLREIRELDVIIHLTTNLLDVQLGNGINQFHFEPAEGVKLAENQTEDAETKRLAEAVTSKPQAKVVPMYDRENYPGPEIRFEKPDPIE